MDSRFIIIPHNSSLFLSSFLHAYLCVCLQAGKGGHLTDDETTIISGALDMVEKTAKDAMTPLSTAFCLDINSKLDMYESLELSIN